NIPQGSTYPELPIPAPGNPNPGYPAPTINWTDLTAKYMDPTTGVLMQRVTAPLDLPSTKQTGLAFSFAFDVNGNAWTNVRNAITKQQSGSLATTNTVNAPLFLAADSGWIPYCCGVGVSDEQVVLYGRGNTGTEIAQV